MPVYMIRQGARGPVKIGVARDVAKRLATMQTGNHEQLTLLRSFDGSVAEERALHRKFADHRLAGEWFSFTKAMLGDVGLVEEGRLEPAPEELPSDTPQKEAWEHRVGGFMAGFKAGFGAARSIAENEATLAAGEELPDFATQLRRARAWTNLPN